MSTSSDLPQPGSRMTFFEYHFCRRLCTLRPGSLESVCRDPSDLVGKLIGYSRISFLNSMIVHLCRHWYEPGGEKKIQYVEVRVSYNDIESTRRDWIMTHIDGDDNSGP